MFTETSTATTFAPSSTSVYGAHKPIALTAQELHQMYRNMAFSLIDVTNPQLFYRVLENDQNSYNGFGIHEKLIHNGMSVVDVSLGNLDYPWFAADANPRNEINFQELQILTNSELNPVVSKKLRAISNFAAQLPAYTKYYHYSGRDGVRAITIEDTLNAIKFNCVITQHFSY